MNLPRKLKRSSISFEKNPNDTLKITKLNQPYSPKNTGEDLKLTIKPKPKQQLRRRGRSYTVSSPVHNALIYHQRMADYHKVLIQSLMLEQLVKSEQKLENSEQPKEINLDTTKTNSLKSKLASLRTNILRPLKIF